MSDVTGPISTLPGSRHRLPKGTMCDMHPDRPAVARVQGETDSMGCEMNDLCQECLDEVNAYERSAEARSGRCDWCKTDATDLRDARCSDEGMCGPVYRVCGRCHERQKKRLQEELDRYADQYGDCDDLGDWDDD